MSTLLAVVMAVVDFLRFTWNAERDFIAAHLHPALLVVEALVIYFGTRAIQRHYRRN